VNHAPLVKEEEVEVEDVVPDEEVTARVKIPEQLPESS
jgi:hypothetical protein